MLVKVISTKTVFGDKGKILKTVMENQKTEHFLYRVFGEIEAQQTGKGRHKRVDRESGESVDTFWTKFFGEFYAMNSDSEEFEGATVFLPEYISGQFKSQLDSGVTGITFAYDVFAVYSEGSITSYEFIAKPVKQSAEPTAAEQMKVALLAAPLPKAKALEHKKK